MRAAAWLALLLLCSACVAAAARDARSSPAGTVTDAPDGSSGRRSGTAEAGGDEADVPSEVFARHVERARARLRARSMPSRDPADIALNLPFERTAAPSVPYRGRFLLFHGLNDSPAVWHDFADALVARGYTVRALLFDGHGSTPEEMLEADHVDWIAEARRQLRAWLDEDEAGPVHLGGFSMGGVVATLLALEEPRVAGLLLISPAYRSTLERWLRFAGIYALFRPWVFGGMILEDNPIKYNSIPINSGWQFYSLTRRLARRWRPDDRIDVPTLLVLSTEDSVVDVEHTIGVFRRRFVHPDRHLIVYAPKIGADDSPGTGKAYADVAREAEAHEETRDSRRPELRVLGQSHLSLTNAPSNELFGRDGRILVCNGNEYPVFMACMRSPVHWYGAQHTPSPDGVPVARTTWNPDWSHVLSRFDEVFDASDRDTSPIVGSSAR